MFNSKTLEFHMGTDIVSIWNIDEDFITDNIRDDSMVDDICDKLQTHYEYINAIDDRKQIADLRENLVDFIWQFAYDEFEDNESFITLAKCTEPDLIISLGGCMNYLIERQF